MARRAADGLSGDVAITWVTTFEQLPEAERLLIQVLAWLAPEPVPLCYFDAELLKRKIFDPRACLAGRFAFSLAQLNATGDAVLVHRLVQEVSRSRGEPADKARFLELTLSVLDNATTGDPEDISSWSKWTLLTPHVATVVSQSEAVGLTGPTSRLMNDLGLFLHVRCQFSEAEPLVRRALAIDEASFGPAHPNVAIRLNNLALLLQDTNRFAEAEPLSRRAVEVLLRFTQSTRHQHPQLRKSFLNHTGLLPAMGQSPEEITTRMMEIACPLGISREQLISLVS